MMGSLTGKVALVTGGAKGIGAAIVRLFVAEGAKVAIAGRTPADAERLAKELGPNAIGLKLEVTKLEDWEAAIKEVERVWGKLNVLVNNAGLSEPSSIEDATVEAWRAHLATNLDGPFFGCRTAIPLMKASGENCSIVNIGSAFALRPLGSYLVYSASKAGVSQLTQSIALHCAAKGYKIRANVVHPGGTETPMLERALHDTGFDRQVAYDYFSKIHPMGRLGKPEEVARAVLFLASDASSFTTGSELSVDGGSAIRE